MFTFFTDIKKWKAYISQSSALGGEETGQDKNKEKECDADEEKKIISCPPMPSKHLKMHIIVQRNQNFIGETPNSPDYLPPNSGPQWL